MESEQDLVSRAKSALTRLVPILAAELPAEIRDFASSRVDAACMDSLALIRQRDPFFALVQSMEIKGGQAREKVLANLNTYLNINSKAGADRVFENLTEAQGVVQDLESRKLRLRRLQDERLYSRFKREIGGLARDIDRDIRAYRSAAMKMADFFGNTRGLWDLSAGDWRRIHWEGLEDAARFLSTFPELSELAKRLGRRRGGRAAAERPEESFIVQVDSLGKSEIQGYTMGRDLSLLPAGELVLLSDPNTEEVFLKKHAEGRLVNLDYLTQGELRIPRQGTPERPEASAVADEEGPVIICVDTSGSMTGTPERVAKALSLALIRACVESGRPAYLIAFSTDLVCFDVSDPAGAMAELSAFMDHSFRGGTDLRPALGKSFELLAGEKWKDADLVILSDFRVPKIMIKKARIAEAIRREKGARIHALSIAPVPPTDDLHLFDSRWHFRTGGGGNAGEVPPGGFPLGISPGQFREVLDDGLRS